jgi:ABC-type antimicrobial peptide transport system permease subunit
MGIVLLESGWRVGVGALVGVILTIGVGAGLSRVLYGVRPLDPVVLAGVVVLITVVALVATFAPARRAAAADPMVAMRSE